MIDELDNRPGQQGSIESTSYRRTPIPTGEKALRAIMSQNKNQGQKRPAAQRQRPVPARARTTRRRQFQRRSIKRRITGSRKDSGRRHGHSVARPLNVRDSIRVHKKGLAKKEHSGNHQRSWLWGLHAVGETLRPVNGRSGTSTSAAKRSSKQPTCWPLNSAKGIPVELVESSRLEQLSGSSEHQGWLARMGGFLRAGRTARAEWRHACSEREPASP